MEKWLLVRQARLVCIRSQAPQLCGRWPQHALPAPSGPRQPVARQAPAIWRYANVRLHTGEPPVSFLQGTCYLSFTLIRTYNCTQIRFLKLSKLSISVKYKVLQFAIPLCGKTNFATFWEVAVSVIHKHNSVLFWIVEHWTICILTSLNLCLCDNSPIHLNINTTSQ